MKKLALCLVLSVLALCGCAHQYVIKLTNGVQLTTASKPKLKGSTYHYKDAMGRDMVVSQSRVVEIEPASMASEENQFKVSQPHPKHWWQFWK